MRSPPIKEKHDFSRLYNHAHLTVFRYIYSLHGGPLQDVEDLTADTFTRAWNARTRFSGSQEAAVGWLLKIARRLVIDAYRRRKVAGFTLDVDDLALPSQEHSPEELALLNDQLGTLAGLLETLSLEQREMLVLRYVLGWRVKDIGTHLEIPENTVSVNIRRLLERLRKNWPS
jgi:RNA polymerase sigma-70 factor (ECF subfamily)